MIHFNLLVRLKLDPFSFMRNTELLIVADIQGWIFLFLMRFNVWKRILFELLNANYLSQDIIPFLYDE